MVFRNWLLALIAGIVASVPVAGQDVNAALQDMCEGVEPYDPADSEAMRANADDFCAILLSEPRKARSQLNKMIVRNRAALNPNRWYIDARKVPPQHRARYDGAFVQLRRPWMDASWRIFWERCDTYAWGLTFGGVGYEYHCFSITKDELTGFDLLIRWDEPEGSGEDNRQIIARTGGFDRETFEPIEAEVVIDIWNPDHGLDRIGEMIDTEYGDNNLGEASHGVIHTAHSLEKRIDRPDGTVTYGMVVWSFGFGESFATAFNRSRELCLSREPANTEFTLGSCTFWRVQFGGSKRERCGAVAMGDNGEYGWGGGVNLEDAKDAAIADCNSRFSGASCRIASSEFGWASSMCVSEASSQ